MQKNLTLTPNVSHTRLLSLVDNVSSEMKRDQLQILTWKNVFEIDSDVIVPVRPTLLMPESQSVQELMNHDAMMNAASLSYRQCLLASLAPH